MNFKLILAVTLIAALAVVESEGRRNRRWVQDENEIDTIDEDQNDDTNSEEFDSNEDDDDEDDLVRRSIDQSQQFPQFPDQDSEYQADGQQTQGGDEFQEFQNNDKLEQFNEVEEFQPTPDSQNYGEQSQRTDEQDYLAKQPPKYETDRNSIDVEEKPEPARPWYKKWGSAIKGFFKDAKNKIREGRDYNYRD